MRKRVLAWAVGLLIAPQTFPAGTFAQNYGHSIPTPPKVK
jgi:hypothetical protein